MPHMKRYSMPKNWPLSIKEKIWVGKPMPGPHKINDCITLGILLRNVLNYTESSKESKKILNEGKILIDKKVKKEINFPIGLMDLIELSESKDFFRVNIKKTGLFLEKIKSEEADKKICRILNKTITRGNKCQLNLHDGRNLLVNDAKKYKTNDSILIQLPNQKILKHFKFDKNSVAIIINGKNKGLVGKIKEIENRKIAQEKASVILTVKGKEIETLKEYVMVGDFNE